MPSKTTTSTDKQHATTSKNIRALTRFQQLRWTQPHGATGLLSLALGYYLVVACALRGNLEAFTPGNNNAMLVLAFVASTLLSAVFGYRLTGSEKSYAAKMFQRMAILQCHHCYYILRFLPFSMWQYYDNGSIDATRKLVVISLDTLAAISMIITILSGLRPTQGENPVLDVASVPAFATLLLPAVYPVQLALGGWGVRPLRGSPETHDYWTCIQERYPKQGVAMCAFIYVPITVVFSVIIFGATLYQRKIISPTTFAAAMLGMPCSILVMTVLSQEMHAPHVSTQRIYLPCVEPVEGSWEASIVTALDFSLASRHVLTWMGFVVPPPPPPQ